MDIRAMIDIVDKASDKPISSPEEIYQVIGNDLKSLLKLINLEAIDSIDLAQHIMGTIDRVYTREGVPQPISLATMYQQDDREEELALAKKAAEVRKIDAQAKAIMSGSMLRTKQS